MHFKNQECSIAGAQRARDRVVFYRAKGNRQLKIISKDSILDWNLLKSFRKKNSMKLYYSYKNFSKFTSNKHLIMAELFQCALIVELKLPQKVKKEALNM